jgi:hypothetical protein
MGRARGCTKSVLLIHIGTACSLKREGCLGPRLQFCLGAGPRTRVTVFAGFASYRFFLALRSECIHATAIPQCSYRLGFHSQTCLGGSSALRLHQCPSGGHASAGTQNSSRRMLLPLRGIAFRYRVREDVRFEETSVALVDEDLRQTSHAYANQ